MHEVIVYNLCQLVPVHLITVPDRVTVLTGATNTDFILRLIEVIESVHSIERGVCSLCDLALIVTLSDFCIRLLTSKGPSVSGFLNEGLHTLLIG